MPGGIIHNPELSLALFSTGAFSGLEPCPRCHGIDQWPEVSLDDSNYGIFCATCDWVGPRASAADGNPDEAIAAWNREARQIRQARTLGLDVNLVQPMEVSCG
jgi:hypothetical protein